MKEYIKEKILKRKRMICHLQDKVYEITEDLKHIVKYINPPNIEIGEKPIKEFYPLDNLFYYLLKKRGKIIKQISKLNEMIMKLSKNKIVLSLKRTINKLKKIIIRDSNIKKIVSLLKIFENKIDSNIFEEIKTTIKRNNFDYLAKRIRLINIPCEMKLDIKYLLN